MEDDPEPRKVLCDVCKHLMPAGAKRCNACQRYHEGWRRWIDIPTTTVALLSAIFGALVTIGAWGIAFIERDSSTAITFLAADASKLTINATNTGRRASVVRDVALSFDESVGIAKTPLEFVRGENATLNAVQAGQSVALDYAAIRGYSTNKVLAEVQESLRGAMATIEVEVEESNGRRKTLRHAFAASRIADFVLAKIPSRRQQP